MKNDNICSYKKCGNKQAYERSGVKGRFICEECYNIIKEKIKIAEKKRCQNPQYLEAKRIRSRVCNQKKYRNNKNDVTFMKARREYFRKYVQNRKDRGDISVRFKSLKDNARKCGGTNLTKQDLTLIVENESCYISGISLSKASKNQKNSYFLDRIGKISNGGDGVKGGNYNKDNVKPALFVFNQLREKLGISAEEMEYLFLEVRQSKNPEILEILEKIATMDFSKEKKDE